MSDSDFEQIKKLQQERNAAAAAKSGSRSFDPANQRSDNSTKPSWEKYGTPILGQYTATRAQIDEFARGDGVEEDDPLAGRGEKSNRITDRETDYQKRRFDRVLTPTRADPFAANRHSSEEEERVRRAIEQKMKEGGPVEEHQPTLQDSGNKENEGGWLLLKLRLVGSARRDGMSPLQMMLPRHQSPRRDLGGIKPPSVPAPGAPGAEPKKRSRWDQAPSATPVGNVGLATPMHPTQTAVVPPAFGADAAGRYAPLSDEELDAMLPGPEQGFTRFLSRHQGDSGVGDLQFFKPEDMAYFGKLTDGADEESLSVEELKERKIMRLLLKVKNGTPPMRKTALRQLTDNARNFGAGPLFNQILPLLMEKTLEDQERHLLVKVIDRILYKLDDMVRPYVHKILVVIEPLLIDQDYYARVEGREIISNLSKAAGLATMISVMRPDIDHVDEYVRNTTARAFAVVASALGIPALLPFLRAVCRSKKSWQARHTGVKIVQQIPILMGCAVLPHLKQLVDCIGPNLNDEQTKVRTVTSLAIAALAEASNPYGIESFDDILNPLWTGARKQRGKGFGGLPQGCRLYIPLMDEDYANYYTSQIMEILLREFASPDEEMKKVVLKVDFTVRRYRWRVTAGYLKEHVLDEFFKSFWVRRMALDKRNYRQVVETTVDIGQKSEAYRKMTVETVEKIVASLGAADNWRASGRTPYRCILHAFQEQSVEDIPYLPQIVSNILWRLNNKSATQCGEDALMGKLGIVLYEYLGEEYPEVLGSILGALRSIVTVVGISQMQPPIKDLLPRLTPILRNRHEKVQENTIDLVGRIADRGPESVNAREWMRICFELLDMLKAHKKGIRRAANNTFGFIAKAIGPQDVLATLLNNLRVQERQSRVNTAVAIGIVAETCAPFTVLPALMNEYRVPELNVQNGVLKSLSFLFEYIGEMAKDYVYAVTPLLEDALIDRDQVHRQTAASVVKHIALGVVGLGCEDAMVHLLNLLYPNLFETSPHVIDRIVEAIEAIRMAVGPGLVLNYVWAGLFHPARKVRTPYWRLYNDAYVQCADAMVPYYPNLIEEGIDRTELAIVL
ncbi:U2 snRNP component prp10 [Neurospora crassa]|nr:U2 snRNP component prp10 [Neurospora crassa]